MSLRLSIGVVFLGALGLAACDSHGGDVTPNNPLNPTVSPSGQPTTSPTGTPTPAPPTATPTTAPTGPTPTPLPTATVAVCSAPPPDPNATTIPLTGGMQTITVPCFHDFTTTATIPSGTVANGASLALQATTDSGAFGIPSDATAGTRLLTTSIAVTATITLGNPNISTAVTSQSSINPGRTYTVENYLGTTQTAKVTGLSPTGHTLTFNVTDPAGTVFPVGVTAYVVVYQN